MMHVGSQRVLLGCCPLLMHAFAIGYLTRNFKLYV